MLYRKIHEGLLLRRAAGAGCRGRALYSCYGEIMIPVKITMHSEPKGQEDTRPIVLVAFGQLAERNGTTYVRYEESAVTGMEGTRTTLKWTADTFTIIRRGRYEHRQEYRQGQNSQFAYKTPYFTIPMVAYTRELTILQEACRWQVNLLYDLTMDGAANGSIQVRIDIEEDISSGHEKSIG